MPRSVCDNLNSGTSLPKHCSTPQQKFVVVIYNKTFTYDKNELYEAKPDVVANHDFFLHEQTVFNILQINIWKLR